MTNEELVDNIVCKNCIVAKCKKECSISDKEFCFIFNSALQLAKEKDKQYEEEYIQYFNND